MKPTLVQLFDEAFAAVRKANIPGGAVEYRPSDHTECDVNGAMCHVVHVMVDFEV